MATERVSAIYRRGDDVVASNGGARVIEALCRRLRAATGRSTPDTPRAAPFNRFLHPVISGDTRSSLTGTDQIGVLGGTAF